MIDFILNPKFLIPFLSTVGASLTVLFLQSVNKIDNERKKKLYTVAYMTHVCLRLLQSSLIIKDSTIIPHIEAAKQMIAGDHDLLKTTFLADEFDILTDGAIDFYNIQEEHKILVGYDDIQLLQAFETVLYMHKTEKVRSSLNEFVKVNLKSELTFTSKTRDEQVDILNTYWDYLDQLNHNEDRAVAFILYIILPKVQQYINRKSFLMYSKKNMNTLLSKGLSLQKKYEAIIPKPSFFQESVSGGIQKIIKKSI